MAWTAPQQGDLDDLANVLLKRYMRDTDRLLRAAFEVLDDSKIQFALDRVEIDSCTDALDLIGAPSEEEQR